MPLLCGRTHPVCRLCAMIRRDTGVFDREGRVSRHAVPRAPADPAFAVAHRVGDDEWADQPPATGSRVPSTTTSASTSFEECWRMAVPKSLLANSALSTNQPDGATWLLGALVGPAAGLLFAFARVGSTANTRWAILKKGDITALRLPLRGRTPARIPTAPKGMSENGKSSSVRMMLKRGAMLGNRCVAPDIPGSVVV